MKIVIAPDSFKETLSALEVAQVIEQGFRHVFPDADYQLVPVADGGEGTVQALVDATAGQLITCQVQDPLGREISASYGILGSHGPHGPRAVIEMAAASGLHHVNNSERNPLLTSSFGTGQLIADALERGIRHIILGLGGSATNDGGAGMLQALGLGLFDENNQPIAAGGGALSQLTRIDGTRLHPQLSTCHFEIACDVKNPLLGAQGASAIFGPQKGADNTMVAQLDQALSHFADALQSAGYRDFRDYPGAGAAGGMGLAALSVLHGKLRSGIELVMDAVALAEKLTGADLVITGEGRIDGQTVSGKTPMGVLQCAQTQQVPCIAIGGCLGDNADAIVHLGMQAVFSSVSRIAPLEEVLANARQNLLQSAMQIAATLRCGQNLNK